MAIETRIRKSGLRYRAYWKNPFTGRKESGSWEEDRAEAQKLSELQKWKIKYQREEFRPNGIARTEDPRVCDILLMYNDQAEMRPTTRKMDFYHAKHVVQIIGQVRVHDLKHAHLREFEDSQRQAGIKQNTIQRRLSILRAAVNWCAEREIIQSNDLFLTYKLRRGRDEKFIPPSPREVSAILEESSPHMIRAVVLGYNLGLRIGESELLKLRWEYFNLDEGYAMFVTAFKGEEQWRKVPIKAELLPLLFSWKAEDDRNGQPWCIHWRGKPVKSIKTAWKSALKKAGITRRIRPYDLRHAFATYALEAGGDAGTVATLMGHADTTMIHKHYQHVLDSQKKKVIDALPAIQMPTEKKGDTFGDTTGSISGGFSYPHEKFIQ